MLQFIQKSTGNLKEYISIKSCMKKVRIRNSNLQLQMKGDSQRRLATIPWERTGFEVKKSGFWLKKQGNVNEKGVSFLVFLMAGFSLNSECMETSSETPFLSINYQMCISGGYMQRGVSWWGGRALRRVDGEEGSSTVMCSDSPASWMISASSPKSPINSA